MNDAHRVRGYIRSRSATSAICSGNSEAEVEMERLSEWHPTLHYPKVLSPDDSSILILPSAPCFFRTKSTTAVLGGSAGSVDLGIIEYHLSRITFRRSAPYSPNSTPECFVTIEWPQAFRAPLRFVGEFGSLSLF